MTWDPKKYKRELRLRKKCTECLFPAKTEKEKVLEGYDKTCRPCGHLIKKKCIDCGKEHGWCKKNELLVDDFDKKHKCVWFYVKKF